MTVDENGNKRAEWSKKIIIHITPKALLRLRRKKNCQVQIDYQWYWIRVRKEDKPEPPKVFGSDGKELGKRDLKKILRMMQAR